MAFLISQIKEQKILEMEVNLDDFIAEHKISENAVIHTMVFDKKVFEKEEEVREYLKNVIFEWAPKITETDTHFISGIVSTDQIDDETEVSVELRRGVEALAGDLMPVMVMQEINFSTKGEELFGCSRLYSEGQTLNLNEGIPHIIEICRVAEGEHPSYGKLKITEEHLDSMERNYKSKVAGVDLAVNEDHKKNEAFGWFKDVFRSFDGQILYGQVGWNTKGISALSEKEYRYFSPEFRFNYVHPHSGEEFGATLLGGALTNYPFLKMEAITQLNNKETKEAKVSEKTIDLSEHNAKVVELSTKINAIEGDLKTSNEKNVELSDKIKKLEDAALQVTKEIANKKLFDKQIINAAQLVALNEGKDTFEVLSLSEKMHTKAEGSDKKVDEEIQLSESEKKICEQLDLTPEEYIAGNK